jgi:hypothetical protein
MLIQEVKGKMKDDVKITEDEAFLDYLYKFDI